MKRILATLLIAVACIIGLTAQTKSPADRFWTMDFPLDPDELSATGRNPYFILEPGYTLTLESKTEQLKITALNETRKIGDIETRVVEERETNAGQIIEVSRNFFAISKRTNSVFYFGEEVDMYQGGKVTRHEGAWIAGANGARFGLMIPGLALLKARYYQEIAPGVAMDRAEIVSMNEVLTTPAGAFTNVLKVSETTPLEPAAVEYKYYARGVGLLQDGTMKLVKYGKAE